MILKLPRRETEKKSRPSFTPHICLLQIEVIKMRFLPPAGWHKQPKDPYTVLSVGQLCQVIAIAFVGGTRCEFGREGNEGPHPLLSAIPDCRQK
jgi:hypothetical protein